MTNLVIRDNRSDLALATAEFLVEHSERAVRERGLFTFALAGGSTPRETYALLSSDEYSSRIDWAHTHIFFGDERCVPPDDDQSNYRMARESLLDHVPIPPDQIHRMEGEREDLDSAASDYADVLCQILGGDEKNPPRMDLMLQGMGPDGHTASVFPDAIELAGGPSLVVTIPKKDDRLTRMTVTLPVLNAARAVAFLVAGKEKSAMIHRVLELNGGEPRVPSSFVNPDPGELFFLLDQEAADGIAAL